MTLVFFIGNNMQSFYMWFYVTMRPKVEIKTGNLSLENHWWIGRSWNFESEWKKMKYEKIYRTKTETCWTPAFKI